MAKVAKTATGALKELDGTEEKLSKTTMVLAQASAVAAKVLRDQLILKYTELAQTLEGPVKQGVLNILQNLLTLDATNAELETGLRDLTFAYEMFSEEAVNSLDAVIAKEEKLAQSIRDTAAERDRSRQFDINVAIAKAKAGGHGPIATLFKDGEATGTIGGGNRIFEVANRVSGEQGLTTLESIQRLQDIARQLGANRAGLSPELQAAFDAAVAVLGGGSDAQGKNTIEVTVEIDGEAVATATDTVEEEEAFADGATT